MDSNDGGPVNIDKIVINNQTTETPFKSTPLKTYSKKSPDTAEAKSRYGRTHKRNFNSDFLSTDKHLGNYFNTEHVSRKYFHLSNAKDSYTTSSTKYNPKLSPNGKRRGRPRKSLPSGMKFGETSPVKRSPPNLDSSFQGQVEFQAPAPTSTETLPVPVELDRPAGVLVPVAPPEPLEECIDADWNIGDLCWAYIDGWPYWPGVITRDPTEGIFRKTKVFGRSQTPCVLLHVTFFGDNGLRSWVKINRIMTFSGLDDYQTRLDDFIGPKAKNKDPALQRMYIVSTGRSKKWLAAVSEAESLIPETRHERVKYLHNLYVSKQKIKNSSKDRKRKFEEDNPSVPLLNNSIESSHSTPPPPKRKTVYTPVKNSNTGPSKPIVHEESSTSQPVKVTPLTVVPADKMKDDLAKKATPKDGDDTPTPKRPRGRPRKSVNSPFTTPTPTPKRPAEPVSSGEKRPRGRPRKKPRVLEMEVEKPKSPAPVTPQPAPEPKVAAKSSKKSEKKVMKKLPKAFETYCEQHFDRACDENPGLSEAEIFKYLEKRWSQMASDTKAKYKSRLGDDSDDSDELYSLPADDAEGKVPLAAPTIKTFRRAQHLFSGIKNDKICLVCLMGSETGEEVIKCRGPCCGLFHQSCGETRDPRAAFAPTSSSHAESSPIRKKTPKHTKNLSGEISSTLLNTPPNSQGSPVRKVETGKMNGAVISKTPNKSTSNQKATRSSNIDPASSVKDEKESSETKLASSPLDTPDAKVEGDVSKKDLSSTKEDIKSSKDSLLSEEASKASSEDDAKSDGSSKVPKGRKSRKKSDDKDSTENGKELKWMCGLCVKNKEDPCFICNQFTEDSTFKCSISSCGKLYHESCQNEWPQHQKNGEKAFVCPQHACHTCISDDPRANLPKFAGDKLVRCIHCPTSFHYNNWCVPAGTNLLSLCQIICPRHYKGTSKHVNTSWCQICSIGGSLICCDDCPNSFHPECLKITTPQGKFICEDCETGRYPLYGEVVWVKLGAYRWWPARILFPSEIPENIMKLKHETGMFVVKFFGSHDHYWVNRGKTFLYHEGDGEQVKGRNHLDTLFNLAMKEAAIAFENQERERNEREAGASLNHKPPRYARISVSKLIGKVKPPYSDEVPNRCECTVDMESPCGENSDCINRMLYVECSPDVCPAKDKCQNQKFEKRQYPPLVPFKTNNRGWGLKVLVPLKKGDFVIEYVGEIIDTAEYHRRLDVKQKSKESNYYFLNIDKDTMIDAGPKGNKGRFINHSCSPNCETQKWTVNGITRIGIFAIQDIPKDSELVFNYKLETIGDALVECKCGSPKCIGYIGGKGQGKNNGGEKKHPIDGPPRTPRVRSRGGARPRVPRIKAAVEKITEDTCFTCGEGGELLLCDSASCPKGYHLKCLGLTKQPPGGWVCPWHQCSVCCASKVQRCALCINSYCSQHADGNISLHPLRGVLICFNHSESGSESDIDGKLRIPEQNSPRAQSEDLKNLPKATVVTPPVQRTKPGSVEPAPKDMSKLPATNARRNTTESPKLSRRLSRGRLPASESPVTENEATADSKEVHIQAAEESEKSTDTAELKSPEALGGESLQASESDKAVVDDKSDTGKPLRSRRSDSKVTENKSVINTIPEDHGPQDPKVPNSVDSQKSLPEQLPKVVGDTVKPVQTTRSTRSTPQKLAVASELEKVKKKNEALTESDPKNAEETQDDTLKSKIATRASAELHPPPEEPSDSDKTPIKEARKSRFSSRTASADSTKTPSKEAIVSDTGEPKTREIRSTRASRPASQEAELPKELLSEDKPSVPLPEEVKQRLESQELQTVKPESINEGDSKHSKPKNEIDPQSSLNHDNSAKTKSSCSSPSGSKPDISSDTAVSEASDLKSSSPKSPAKSKEEASAAVTMSESKPVISESKKQVGEAKANTNEEDKTVNAPETETVIKTESDKHLLGIKQEPLNLEPPAVEDSKVVDESAKENEQIQNVKPTPTRLRGKNVELKEPKVASKQALRGSSVDEKVHPIKTETDDHMSVKKVIRSYSRSPKKSESKSEPLPVVVSVPPPELTDMNVETETPSTQVGQLNIKDMMVVFAETSDDIVADSEAVTVNGH